MKNSLSNDNNNQACKLSLAKTISFSSLSQESSKDKALEILKINKFVHKQIALIVFRNSLSSVTLEKGCFQNENRAVSGAFLQRLFTLLFLVCITLNSFAQITVSGTVTDNNDGSPMPGVNVLIKGTTWGTVTDIDGKYAIEVDINTNDTIQFSFIGYLTEKIKINNQAEINVSLVQNYTSLDEVYIIGYGVLKRVDICSSVAVVSEDAFAKGRSRNRKQKKANNNSPTPISNTSSIENESYAEITEGGFKNVSSDPLSTFSIDVDNASYTNVRRFLNEGQKPPVDAIRIEEMVNYFSYNYDQPAGDDPLEIFSEVAACPWNKNNKLMHIGLQGLKINEEELPASNLVFLIDVSGSMESPNKLPLLVQSFKLLANKLREQDRVSIVVYAGAAGVVLPSTSGKNKEKITKALNRLSAGGSTAGGQGIQLAYEIAKKNFIKDGNNRVILATDGDFNVGASSDKDMEKLIEKERENDIFLTCLGFGMGNYKDSKIEVLADKGNGNYAYIDNIQSAQKTLVNEFGGTMFTIAKDVKLQIEFNPAYVQAYRLIGYENRELEAEDFIDDTKDAGELGSGHTVTALYEIIPVGVESEYVKSVNPLKYRKTTNADNGETNNELATVKFRYKEPKGDTSKEISRVVMNSNKPASELSANASFASSVALFGMLLRDSEYTSNADYDEVIDLAKKGKENDEDGYKAEFIRLVKTVKGNWPVTASK